ncbi:unnamed protein product [Didymodactylos carnosus]|uniref:Xylose isomerase-like TIM barrel domain-containing protein n=1 Tax=Didymodactylos carnosus TaxID=1234261 RepID=A0A814E3K3_9BILA|nr:unnamed protein product [Didymodactylos carnosus]CAF1264095.1 unnamed protein product [Didymodactylos carnosus]CAF3735434.1 unnamed protein product [Didymodactylos carnosus]CAF4070489.1 unnamed protein product [Didymodactylos carnosus]
MTRPVTLFTGQWADLSLKVLAKKAKQFSYDGLELACFGEHFNVSKAATDQRYCDERRSVLNEYGLNTWAISIHLISQAVCDIIDERRHKQILPTHVWGNGKDVHKRAAEEVMKSAHAAKNMGINVVNGFTGSKIWHLLYSFPPVHNDQIQEGYDDFAEKWNPILDEFKKCNVKYALEVHPTEIAFDIVSAQRALESLKYRPEFGFNYDPSHLGYQGVDYVGFIRKFYDRIYHVHMKDVYWSWDQPCEAGVFGGYTKFGDTRRFWEFRSLGRGSINFEKIIRALNSINYSGPLSVEWEDVGMEREYGAKEAAQFVRKLNFKPSEIAFDAAFEKQ